MHQRNKAKQFDVYAMKLIFIDFENDICHLVFCGIVFSCPFDSPEIFVLIIWITLYWVSRAPIPNLGGHWNSGIYRKPMHASGACLCCL